jgi:uncharacterized phage-like protein YoqJ
MNENHVCAIIGHKSKDIPLVKKSLQLQIKLKEIIAQELKKLLEEKVYKYMCGMDDGTDLICCEILLGFKKMYPQIHLECVIPYVEQPKHWLAEDRDKYFQILDNCDYKNVMQDEYSNDSYLKRNIYLATKPDIILAISKLGKLSKAETTLRFAGTSGKALVLIHPEKLTCKKYDHFNFG